MVFQSMPQDYYTWSSLRTLAIAAGAVVVVSNTLRTLLKLDTPWIAFGISLLLIYIGAYSTGHLSTASDWALSFLNACLLFCTATGANQAFVAAKPRMKGKPTPYGRRPVKWLSAWFKDNV